MRQKITKFFKLQSNIENISVFIYEFSFLLTFLRKFKDALRFGERIMQNIINDPMRRASLRLANLNAVLTNLPVLWATHPQTLTHSFGTMNR